MRTAALAAGDAPASRVDAHMAPHSDAMPVYSPMAMRLFELFFLPWRRRRLITVPPLGLEAAAAALAADRPLVIVANHTSWWDGFLLRDIHRALRPDAPFHVVMTAHELARFPFFRRIGAVGIERDSAGSILRAFRQLARKAEAAPRSVILYFPQGQIWPAWRRPLGFQRGVELLLRTMPPATALPIGIHIEALNRSAPAAFISVGSPLDSADATTSGLELQVTAQLDRIAALLAERGEEAVHARD